LSWDEPSVQSGVPRRPHLRCSTGLSSSREAMTGSADRLDSVARNIAEWTQKNAEFYDARASHAWVEQQITWGIWNIPESELRALPEVADLEVIELGCGTA